MVASDPKRNQAACRRRLSWLVQMERRFPPLRTVKKRTLALSVRVSSPRTTCGLICTILYAEPANSADIGQTLLKTCKPAILGTGAVAILRAPWIILGFGAISKANDSDANSQREQQEPHGSLMAAKFTHYATRSDGNSEGSSVPISFTDPAPVSTGKLTMDEKQTQHFGQSQT